MLERPETEFLGLRGLIMQALKQNDEAEALRLARRAKELRPKTPWVLASLFELQARAGKWNDAEATLALATRRRALPERETGRHRAVMLHEQSRVAQADGRPRDAVRLADGKVYFGEQSVSFADIGQAAFLHPERLPVGEEPALEASAVYQPGRSTGAFSYATHACVLAVDPGTGHVEVLDYVVCHDCGTMVNPMIVEGQVVGGVAQGLGTALYEEIPYDENGQPLASTFLDYMIPGATEVPDVRVLHMETPSPHTRFGIKGMGEGGAIAPPAVIINAVNDALKPLGAELGETPATPDRVLRAIIAARGIRR